MKRIFRKMLTIAAALVFALPIFLLAACESVEPRSEADVIPETLGEAEGLWLYCGNTRSFSDGTGAETLLTSITVEDVEYGDGEFEIVACEYVRNTCEIFYVLAIGKQYRAYHYNYLTKTSSDLCALTSAERIYDYKISVSSSLVYIYNTRTKYGTIFSSTAQLLYENFYDGTLDGDIVWRVRNDFTYFKDGVIHEVPLGDSYRADEYRRYENLVYFFGDTACGVDLDREECFVFSAIKEIASRVHFANIYEKDGAYYAVIVNYITYDDHDTEHVSRLFKISDKKAQLLHEFGNAPYGITMRIDGNLIYLTQKGARANQAKYFVCDIDTGTIKKVSSRQGGKGKLPEEISNEEAAKQSAEKLKSELIIGEYTFYVTSLGYDDQPGMFGRHYTKTCYYLMRDSEGRSEVMQYSLNLNGGHFYDDVREF